jgi:hypothetical protein
VVTAAGTALLMGLTLPADATAPPADGSVAGSATAAPARPGAERAAEATVRPAVRPPKVQTATADYACMGRHSIVKLRAARVGGGRVEVTMTASGLTSPVTLAPGDVRVTLRLTARRGGGHRAGRAVVFTGTNPHLRRGGPLRAGPLRAKVAAGARLNSFRGRDAAALELRRGLLGVRCTAETAQRPGPFRF